MQELIGRVAAVAGMDAETAGRAVGLVLRFLKQNGPQLEVGELVAALPGADQAMQGATETAPGSGIMGLVGELSAIGLDMGEMQAVGKELFAVAREKVGEDVVGRIVAAIPGLSQVV